MPAPFSYAQAFDRNIGWVTEAEQASLRGRCVAIAGMGGVGGWHLLTLVRMGIGRFRLADFDTFDIANFNRQAGATMDSIGRPKLDVMAEMALAINPELEIARFPHGVTDANIDDFLDGADLFVDGFDFFALGIRRLVFARAEQLGIPAVTAAPIGLGTGYLAFVPGGMPFEEYFRFEGQTENEQYLRFLMGVAPQGLHRAYLVDPSRINLAEKRGPSMGASCQLCAGVVGTMALQLLLQRPGLRAAPYHHHFDPMRGRLAVTRLPQGNDTPSQRIRLALARKMLAKPKPAPMPPPAAAAARTPLEEILDAARWAPSGDNTQPWRFETLDGDTVRIHLPTEAGTNPYEYRDGEPSLLSGGMLLENLRIAASVQGRRLDWSVEGGSDPYSIIARMPEAPGIAADRLHSVLALRSVDRRPYLSRPLRPAERAALEASAGSDLQVSWYEDRGARLRMARLGALATDIRLRAQEAFAVHQKVIDWSPGHSATGLPAGAIGLDRATLRIMRWAMTHWPRMHGMNRVSGTWAAAAQLDLRPALGSAAFFTLAPAGPDEEDRVTRALRLGGAVQRFWLTATRLGLAMQPGLATLIFSHYGAHGLPFTADPALRAKARKLAARFQSVLGRHPDSLVFLGRIGQPRPGLPKVRSTRLEVADLRHAGTTEDRPTAEAGLPSQAA
jgi:nitroreductase